MTMTASTSINLRISTMKNTLIVEAAHALGKNRTVCILENSLHAAEEVLADRTRFTLISPQWEAFTAALDTPPSPAQAQKLARMLSVVAPW